MAKPSFAMKKSHDALISLTNNSGSTSTIVTLAEIDSAWAGMDRLSPLLHLADLLHRRDQARAVGFDEFCELRRVHIGDRAARGLEGPGHFRRVHRLCHRFAQPRHDRRRQRCLREQSGPDVELDVLVAELLE